MNNKAIQKVNNLIMEELDKGIVPWSKPWKTINGVDIKNGLTKKSYSGINPVMLTIHARKYGFECPYYATFNQIKKMKGSLSKGSSGAPVVFFDFFTKEEKNSKGDTVEKSIPFLKYYTVFNLAQTTGIEWTGTLKDELEGLESPVIDRTELLQGYISGPSVDYSASNRAYYSGADFIQMPLEKQFKTEAGFYGTLHHELIHSTGHIDRLNRKMGMKGTKGYAKEELIAEAGSAYLNFHYGFDLEIENKASYIASWKSKLKDNPSILVSAFSGAEKGAEYILSRIPSANNARRAI